MLDTLFDTLFPKKKPPAGPVDYIVAGLGNPGKEYEHTRHNIGFMAVDKIGEELGFPVKKLQFQSLTGDTIIGGKRVLFLKPSTYMNLSGQAVRDALQFYKLPVSRLIVISDEAALDIGKMRIRRKGSDGGQKGLRNIIYLTGSDDFPRIRLGVGKKPHPDISMADWVLSRFTEQEFQIITPLFHQTLQTIEWIVTGNIAEAMNRFN